jgi:hypothetical protein
MTTQLISIHTTIRINEEQVDICYHFPTSELEIFIDGTTVTKWHFNPSRTTFNQINMITLAVQAWEKWSKRKNEGE